MAAHSGQRFSMRQLRSRLAPLLHVLVVAATALAIALADSAAVTSAASPHPLHFDLVGNVQLQQPVEQQSDYPFDPRAAHYVVNPTSCSWDVDDSWQRIAVDGYLEANATATFRTCMVSDATAYTTTKNGLTASWSSSRGYLGVLVHSPVSRLVVSVCYSLRSRCFAPAPQFNTAQKRYDYVACTQAVYDPGDPDLVSIPDSNGGTGVVSQITLEVANPTSRQIRSIGADIEVVGVGAHFAAGACGYAPLPRRDYPWSFSLSGGG